jgi:hypothetical protein
VSGFLRLSAHGEPVYLAPAAIVVIGPSEDHVGAAIGTPAGFVLVDQTADEVLSLLSDQARPEP